MLGYPLQNSEGTGKAGYDSDHSPLTSDHTEDNRSTSWPVVNHSPILGDSSKGRAGKLVHHMTLF